MSDVSLTQSVLQTTQVDRIQDQQQRQAGVDQKILGHQFSERVDQRRSQVEGSQRIESDALPADGRTEGGAGEPFEDPSGASAEEEDAAPAEPDLGGAVDVKA